MPKYAHLPYVAEPGSKTKLSKRKLAKYLKSRDFAQRVEHGANIAQRIGLQTDPDTFNPVIVDFYEKVGYLPEALVNYLALLGWSLDDKTEDFSCEELIEHFSLDRVNKAPAGFDVQRLWAFQERHMLRLPIDEKAAMVRPYLERAKLIDSAEAEPKIAQILEAAGDRIKTAGDILNFDEFFVADEKLTFDEKAFEKRIRKPAAGELLGRFKDQLTTVEPFDAATLEKLLHHFVEAEGIKIGQIIHALRVAVTGKAVGLGMFDTMAILGRESCLARMERALGQL